MLPVVIQPCFSQSSSYEAKNSLMETQESIVGIALSCNNMVYFVFVIWMRNINKNNAVYSKQPLALPLCCLENAIYNYYL